MQLKSSQKKTREKDAKTDNRVDGPPHKHFHWEMNKNYLSWIQVGLSLLDVSVEFLLAYAAQPTKTYHFVFVLHTLQ